MRVREGIRVHRDTDRLDKIERAGIRSTRVLFGAHQRVGWVVTDEGDVLCGAVEDYEYSTLRKAIDTMKEKP